MQCGACESLAKELFGQLSTQPPPDLNIAQVGIVCEAGCGCPKSSKSVQQRWSIELLTAASHKPGSCREEREKLNIWVAYLNLENTYGQPPDEAVMKLFQRALQHVDQKKLYLALLAILDSSKKAYPLSLLARSKQDCSALKQHDKQCLFVLAREADMLRGDLLSLVKNREDVHRAHWKHLQASRSTGAHFITCLRRMSCRSISSGHVLESGIDAG